MLLQLTHYWFINDRERFFMKRVVITGATGAIGRALIKICIEAGYKVLAVVHRTSESTIELKTIENCQVLYLNLAEYDHEKT